MNVGRNVIEDDFLRGVNSEQKPDHHSTTYFDIPRSHQHITESMYLVQVCETYIEIRTEERLVNIQLSLEKCRVGRSAVPFINQSTCQQFPCVNKLGAALIQP